MSKIFNSIKISQEVKDQVDKEFKEIMETTFKLGPLQTLWLKQLRAHPERQMTSLLGEGNPRDYKACCLGELHLCTHRLAKKKLPFDQFGKISDDSENDHTPDGYLTNSFGKYGLVDKKGSGKKRFKTSITEFESLAQANDAGVYWTEIADIIEKDPTNFFTKSV